MFLEFLALIVLIYIFNSRARPDYDYNQYYSQSSAFMKQPYYRPEQYQWRYGPGYYSTSDLGKK